MRIASQPVNLNIDGIAVCLRRVAGGTMRLEANDDLGLARGMGFAHAYDRQTQLMLARLAGQGRLCECLRADEASLGIDRFMRQMGFARQAAAESERLSEPARRLVESYCRGVNHCLRTQGRPWEFRLLGYTPEPWTPADTLLVVGLMTYVGLAQSQQDLEKLLVQAVQGGASLPKLQALFRPHLDGLDDATVQLLRQVRIAQPLVPALASVVPVLTASNNWAVAASSSAGGGALQANDPHLECNRLPPVWYEFVAVTPDDYRIGVNTPGVPGLVMGRTKNISLGFTYGFMDLVDYFIEDCRDGRCRRADGWVPLAVREETILRRRAPPMRLRMWESDCGILETDAADETLPDGLHLCRAYAGHGRGMAQTLDALARITAARNVEEAQHTVRDVAISCNWLIADRQGNIGYQQSGLLPVRAHSGLYPLPAWEEPHRWRGFHPPERLATIGPTAAGVLVTANDDRNQPDKPLSVNASMGPYRRRRIEELLAARQRLTLDDLRRIQLDLTSTQARRFMQVLRPLMPETPAGRLLAEWDWRYDLASRGATLFEDFYVRLLREVFGNGLFGAERWQAMENSTGLVADYFHRFDDELLDGDERLWFGAEGRAATLRRILAEVVGTSSQPDADSIPRWGARRRLSLPNVLLGGKLPGWLARRLRLDYRPIELAGGRATIVQGAIFRSHGRTTTFAPSYRYLTDMAEDAVETALAGGASDRSLDLHYADGVGPWLRGEYKRLEA